MWAKPHSAAVPPMIQLAAPGALNQRSAPKVNAKQIPPHTRAIPSVTINETVSLSTWRDMIALARQRAK